jgi:outer membrane receptor protein involved in Fe transport
MMISGSAYRAAWLAGAALATYAAWPAPAAAAAQAQATKDFDLPAQDLALTLRAIARQSGKEILFAAEIVEGHRAPPVKGRFTAEGAVRAALAGTDLVAEVRAGALLVRRREPDSVGQQAAPAAPDSLVTVTGTRIRGAAPVGSSVIRITRSDMERSGYATTQDIAQTIPQNFGGAPNEATGAISLDPNSSRNTGAGSSLNLRGLGNASTLLLLNGDRPPLGGFGGVFADVSMIPAVAIERIEVIADGASAIYGSDAVAGVVNIVPRLSFKGAESNFRIGTADGDSEDMVASQILGTQWRSGRAILAYEFYRRDALAAGDRSYITDDLRRFGGPDLRGDYANPGTILAGGQTFAIPAGQDGRHLQPGDLVAGTVNLGDSWSMVDILPAQTRHSLFAAARQTVAPHIDLYAQALYSSRAFSQHERTAADAPQTVPTSNPFYVDPIGTHQPVQLLYDFGPDLGRERRTGNVRALGATLGVQAGLGRWSLDLRGNYGRQTETSKLLNRVNSARLAVALADPDPATAYDLFGDGPATNPRTIDFVRGSTVSRNRARVWSLSARADGPLAELPGGTLRVALGGEYRNELYAGAPGLSDTATLEPVVRPPTPLPGPRRIRAFYGEILLPVFGGDFVLPGFERLDLSAALRTEHYSDFGSTTNPKIGFAWQPLRGLRLRGTYGRSFRAPAIDNLRQDAGAILLFAFTIPDPQSPTGSSNVLVRRGNDPNLQPEKATSWTLGADLEPRLLPGLRASLTYYNIDYRDRITSPAANLFNFLVNRDVYRGIIEDNPSPQTIAAFYSSPYFVNPLGIAPDTIVATVDARLQNLSVVKQSGLDLDLGYRFRAFGGDAEVGASGAYIFRIDQAITPDAPVTNVVDILGNPVDLRLRGRASWTNDRWAASLFVNYLDSYTNLTNPEPEKVDSWTTLDAQLSYRFKQQKGPLAGLRLALSATNLLDTDPPYAAYNLGLVVSGFDPDNASPLGRVVSFTATKTW